ncbi:hypothetical protein PR048_011139 [Dryococelus australis]|uniref:Uncharacterized protein n=1 Tax=Dryococelus australis TaxID=614101 RepID=A0ABQ9HKS1_9NEOP|nr:hypothetical protein PR048_011139 [Dryococelus australis]
MLNIGPGLIRSVVVRTYFTFLRLAASLVAMATTSCPAPACPCTCAAPDRSCDQAHALPIGSVCSPVAVALQGTAGQIVLGWEPVAHVITSARAGVPAVTCVQKVTSVNVPQAKCTPAVTYTCNDLGKHQAGKGREANDCEAFWLPTRALPPRLLPRLHNNKVLQEISMINGSPYRPLSKRLQLISVASINPLQALGGTKLNEKLFGALKTMKSEKSNPYHDSHCMKKNHGHDKCGVNSEVTHAEIFTALEPKYPHSKIWTALNSKVLRANEGDMCVWSSSGMKGQGKQEIPEEIRHPTALSHL